MKDITRYINLFLENKIVERILEPKIFFLFVAFLLIQLWFSKGILFGGVEVGVPTYNPGSTLKQIVWTWWESSGPGVSFPTIAASIPLYIFMAVGEYFSINALGIQKFLFFLIIYIQGIGASLLFRKFFPQNNKLAILAGLFYIFNPFMMTYVWHRFIFGGIILSAALPLLVYFYLKLLEEKKIKFILYFLFTSLIASYMYSAVAPAVAIWLSMLIIFLSETIINRRDIKQITHYAFLSAILFIFWLVTNIWWIYPLIGIKTIFSVFSASGGVDTLIALSEKSTINYVIRGINPYYLFIEEDWGSIYRSLLLQSLSWIPIMFILAGLILGNKRKRIWPIILFFMIGIFVAKGAAEPLGNVTAWIYSHLFFLGVIRNPFEKLGLLVVLPASILITVGINNLWNLSKSIYLKIIVIALIIGCGFYIWPMWSDKLFGSEKYPLFFTLPPDYTEVSNFLSKELKSENGKILHLPISEGDSATYNWEYPYNGTEIASFLFPGSSISKFLYISYIDQLLQETARIFHTDNYDLQRRLISAFGVRYIVLNRNLDWYYRAVDNPQQVEKILDSSPDLKIIKNTENLKVYKFMAKPSPQVFSANSLSLLSGYFNNGSETNFILTKALNNGEVFLQETQRKKVSKQLLQKEIIMPRRVFENGSALNDNPDTIIPRPYVKYLPGTPHYQFVLLKEKIELWLAPNYEKPMKMLLLTQKRLMESKELKEQKKEQEFTNSINRYTDYLTEAINQIKGIPDEEFEIDQKIILKIATDEEKKLLEDFKNNANNKELELLIEKNIRKILDFRKDKGLEVYYPVESGELLQQSSVNVYQFIIPEDTKAELIMTFSNSKLYDQDKNRINRVFLDGLLKDVSFKQKDNKDWFSLGEIQLNPGIHEIALPVNEGKILKQHEGFDNQYGEVEVKNPDKLIAITTSEDESWIEYQIPNYNPDATYTLSFYYRVIKGATPEVQFWQNSDRFKNKSVPKIVRNMPENFYNFDWNYTEFSISTNQDKSIRFDRSTADPRIRIVIPFWNNCRNLNYRKVELCQNPEFRKTYNKPSKVDIRDVKLEESFKPGMVLERTLGNSFTSPAMKFKKISPVEYWVETDNKDSNLFVVLGEGFHNGWQVIFDSTKEIVNEKNHYLTNGYANGWLINKSGKLSFKIQYIHQEYFYKAILVSTVAYVVIILITCRKRIFRKLL